MATTAYHYYHCRTPKRDRAYRRDPQYSPERLSNVRLKNRLCRMGPAYCATCRGCGYGAEWLRRHPEGGAAK